MEIILSVRSVALIGVIEVNFIDVIDMLREKRLFKVSLSKSQSFFWEDCTKTSNELTWSKINLFLAPNMRKGRPFLFNVSFCLLSSIG